LIAPAIDERDPLMKGVRQMSTDHDFAQRRARARRTALFVGLAAAGIYLLFWLGGVLRS